MKVVPAGIKRFKQHLSGGFGDAIKCPRVSELVSKEMHVYLKRNSKVLIDLDYEFSRLSIRRLKSTTRIQPATNHTQPETEKSNQESKTPTTQATLTLHASTAPSTT
jgi:hypothetical protein